jgi:hypothetical protein
MKKNKRETTSSNFMNNQTALVFKRKLSETVAKKMCGVNTKGQTGLDNYAS